MSDALSGDSPATIQIRECSECDPVHHETDVSIVNTAVSDYVFSGDKQDTNLSDMECKSDSANTLIDRNTSEPKDDQLTKNGKTEKNIKESVVHDNKGLLDFDQGGPEHCSTTNKHAELADGSTGLSSATQGQPPVSDGYLSMKDFRSISNEVICDDLDREEKEINLNTGDGESKMSTVMWLGKDEQQVSDNEDEAKRTIEIVFPNDVGMKESLTVKEGDKLVTVSLNIPQNHDETCHTESQNWCLSRSHDEEVSKMQVSSSSSIPKICSSEIGNNGHALDVKKNEKKDDDDDDDVIITSAVIINKKYSGCQDRSQSADVTSVVIDEKETKQIMEEDAANDVGSETISMSSVDDTSLDDILENDLKHLSDNHADNVTSVNTGQNLQDLPADGDKPCLNQLACLPTVDNGNKVHSCNDLATSFQSDLCIKAGLEIHAPDVCKKLPEISCKTVPKKLESLTAVDGLSIPCLPRNENSNGEMSKDDRVRGNTELANDVQQVLSNEDEAKRTIEIVFPNDAGVKESLTVKEGNKLVTVSLNIPENQDDMLHDVSSGWYMSPSPRSHFEDQSSEYCSRDTSDCQIVSVQKRRESTKQYTNVQSLFDTATVKKDMYHDSSALQVREMGSHSWKYRQTVDPCNHTLVWSKVLSDISKINRKGLYRSTVHSSGKRQPRTVTKIRLHPDKSFTARIQNCLSTGSPYQSGVKASYKKVNSSRVLSSKQPMSAKRLSIIINKSQRRRLEKPAVGSSAGRNKQLAKKFQCCLEDPPSLHFPLSVTQQPLCGNSSVEQTYNSVILSPECKKRYSHILNTPPVVSLKRLKIDVLPVNSKDVTWGHMEIPVKRKKGRQPKRRYPAKSISAKIKDDYPKHKQTERSQSVIEVHGKTKLHPHTSEDWRRKQHSECLVNTPCVMLEKLPPELLPPNATSATCLKCSPENCPEGPSTPKQETGEKYTGVLNKSLCVSLERVPLPTLNLDEKQSQQRQRSKSDMDKRDNTASTCCFESYDGLKTTDDLKQQLNSGEMKSEADKNCDSSVKQEDNVKPQKLCNNITSPKIEHCPKCHVITTRRKLYKHYRRVHFASEYPFCCSKCQKKFLFEDIFDKHSQRCGVTNRVLAPSEEDQEDVNQMDSLTSDDKPQNSRSDVSPELSDVPTVLYRCTYCPKAFITPSLLFHHENNFHTNNSMVQMRKKEGKIIFQGTPGMVYLCTNCNSYFLDIIDYKNHQKVAHSSVEHSSTDSRPDTSGDRSEFGEASDHSVVHNPRPTYYSATNLHCQCLVCLKKFFLPEVMEKHTVEDHGVKKKLKEMPDSRIEVLIEQVAPQVNDNKMECSADGQLDCDNTKKLQKFE